MPSLTARSDTLNSEHNQALSTDCDITLKLVKAVNNIRQLMSRDTGKTPFSCITVKPTQPAPSPRAKGPSRDADHSSQS